MAPGHSFSDDHLDVFEQSIAFGHLQTVIEAARAQSTVTGSVEVMVCGLADAVEATRGNSFEATALSRGLRDRSATIAHAIIVNT